MTGEEPSILSATLQRGGPTVLVPMPAAAPGGVWEWQYPHLLALLSWFVLKNPRDKQPASPKHRNGVLPILFLCSSPFAPFSSHP